MTAQHSNIASFESIMEWVQEDFVRPILIFVCAMLLFNLPSVLYKIRMLFKSIVYLVLCWDKSWKKPQDPGAIFGPHLSQGLPVQRKTVYFVRHGESTWNDTFNKGKHRSTTMFVLGFIPGLIKANLYELFLLLTGKLDSWFYDSPLSSLGLSQAEELATFLKEKPLEDGPEAKHIQILRAEPGATESLLVVSNLRRAISTIAVAFRDRLDRKPDERVLVAPSLQEVSRNPDSLSITPPHMPARATQWEIASQAANFDKFYGSHLDMSLHTGDKAVSSNGLKRMLEFCDFLYSPSVKEDCVIIGGHSIWFRSFFRMFLPYSVHHVSKENKLVNCGVVTFELMKAETRRGDKYMIDPKTIRVIYGGF